MRLSVQIEFDKTLDVVTPKTSVIVGRDPECDLVIPHTGVSRRHCKIEDVQGKFFITDLQSSNGVFLNGNRLGPKERTSFKESDPLRFGGIHVKFSKDADALSPEKAEHNSPLIKNDATATIRMSRIELNQPSVTLELQKRPKFKGARNPISHGADVIEIEYRAPWKFIFIVISVLAGGAYYFFFQ